MTRKILIISVLVAFYIDTVLAQGKYPCHANREGGAAYGCSSAIIPHGLCGTCKLKKVDWNGNFVNCRSIYDLDVPGCKGELEKYVAANPCDDKRAEYVASWNDYSKEALDYFVYSVCEQCCDCVPVGQDFSNFDALSATHTNANPTLYVAERGNCPAHAYYDICKVYPNIKYLRLPGGATHDDWPNICPYLNDWFFSPASNNWEYADYTDISYEVKRFLNDVNIANQCNKRNVWQPCRNMEASQGKVRRR